MVQADTRLIAESLLLPDNIDWATGGRVERRRRWFTLSKRTAIVVDPILADEADRLSASIEMATGLRLRVLPHGAPAESMIVLSMNGWADVATVDGFTFDATPTLVIIGSRGGAGMSNGIGALLKFLSDGKDCGVTEWYGRREADWAFPCLYLSA